LEQIFVAEELDNGPAPQRDRSAQQALDDEERELLGTLGTEVGWGPSALRQVDGPDDDSGCGSSGLLGVEALPKIRVSFEKTYDWAFAKAHLGLA